MTRDDELAIIECARTLRELHDRACRKIASRQMGEAWIDLIPPDYEPAPLREAA